MPRARDPNRDKALELFLQHGGEITNRRIAELLEADEKVVAVWKSRDNWSQKLNGSNDVQQTKESCTTKKRGAPKGNKNAVGNQGGPPKGSANALKHGFFRRIFPNDEETLAIVDEIGMKRPIDMLWENIVIQYTAIARAQKLMFVRDQDDMTKELKKEKQGSNGAWEEEHEIQFAWDKHANFLQAQSRAMVALQGLIKQFDELANKDDERRLKLEQMRLNIAKTKAETNPESSGNKTIIITGEDEMRRVLAEKKASENNDGN